MDKTSFGKLIANIFQFYQSQKMPTTQQVDIWFAQVRHIPDESIPHIEQTIYRDRDSLPRNLPKAIKESYELSPKDVGNITYNKDEDFRFPVSKMIEGFNILEKQGLNNFIGFANSIAMPSNDRARVIFKYNVMVGKVQPLDLRSKINTIGNEINIDERISALKSQAEIIMREPGDDSVFEDQIPF